MSDSNLKAPFPYFGGKAVIAQDVWDALGQPRHYIEPFFGSGAVLLNRKGFDPDLHIETVNDKDGFICNAWRAIQLSPEKTAKVCDYPVNHADLIARKARLIKEEGYLINNLCKDDKWHDIELAGYWIWGTSCWIGAGYTTENKKEKQDNDFVKTQRPHIGTAGEGVHAKRPNISNTGSGVASIGGRPHIARTGSGVQSYKGNSMEGIYKWFQELSQRLRYVRVVCGDWSRVCGGNWQDNIGEVGIFLDPPYGITDRDTKLYHCDSTKIAADVLAWCRERGKLKSYRIVIAGYEEYLDLEKIGWRVKQWKTGGGYSNMNKLEEKSQGAKNIQRERLYFSPYCLEKQLKFI